MKRRLSLFLIVLFLLLPLPTILAGNVPIPVCGPHPNLGPTEYCSFAPFIKTGNDDAIIDLSWDVMSPGIQGLPTPDMVGDYYFYFKDGRLYYLGNTTGGYELFYEFYKGLWYLSDGQAINPKKPCIIKNITIPGEIRNKLCSCGNVSIKSPSYSVQLDGSTLRVSNGRVSYTIEVPDNMTLTLPPNVTLRAVFLKRGVLIYTTTKTFGTPLDWKNLTVLYYDGEALKNLNLTEGMKNELPTCPPNVFRNWTPIIVGVLSLLSAVGILIYWRIKS
jgi:hypothetical protein